MSDTAETKLVIASIVKYLRGQIANAALSSEARESVEVGAQCLESAFAVASAEVDAAPDLARLVRERPAEASPEDKAEAERLKNEGNELMKSERHSEALEKYCAAIRLDSNNAVFYCNRAAAHFKLGAHEAAAADCAAALARAPRYGKAHGRLGLALAAQGRHREARASFAAAAALEPDNESYRTNMRLADEHLASAPPPSAAAAAAAASAAAPREIDLGGLLHNPALVSMATEMLADPGMREFVSGLVASAPGAEGGAGAAAGGIGALLEAGQRLAQEMQSANPQLVEQLRSQMQAAAPPAPPAPHAPSAPGPQ